ncbi:MAG: SET domain-containing protein-lysine N-methyltransferase [Caldilineaceae bacterium]
MLTIETNQTSYGARLVTTQPYATGQLIHTITHYRLTATPTYQSIQIGANRHIEDLDVIAYLNHSCHPNVIVDTTALTISAARAIAAGEELTFFYPSTEWAMARPFICQCGARHCLSLVAGAKYLAVDRLAHYFINQHIRDLLVQALNSAGVRPEHRLPSYAPLLATAA